VTEFSATELGDKFDFEHRGTVFVKGKGDMNTYLLVRKKDGATWDWTTTCTAVTTSHFDFQLKTALLSTSARGWLPLWSADSRWLKSLVILCQRCCCCLFVCLMAYMPNSAIEYALFKPKFHYVDFPVTSTTSPQQTRDVPFSPNSITSISRNFPSWAKGDVTGLSRTLWGSRVLGFSKHSGVRERDRRDRHLSARAGHSTNQYSDVFWAPPPFYVWWICGWTDQVAVCLKKAALRLGLYWIWLFKIWPELDLADFGTQILSEPDLGALILGSQNSTPDETNDVNNAVSCYKQAVQMYNSVLPLLRHCQPNLWQNYGLAMNFVFFYRPSNANKIASAPLDRSAALVLSVINWTFCSCTGIWQIRLEIWPVSRAQLTRVLSLPEGATAHGVVGRLGFSVRVTHA